MVDDVILEVVTGLGSGATSVLAYFLYRQTHDLRKQTQLASAPEIFPRYILTDSGRTRIYLFNVGKGNAIDIHLDFRNNDRQPLGIGHIDRYTLLTIDIPIHVAVGLPPQPESIDTGIEFIAQDFTTDNPFRYRIEGWYRDTNEDMREVSKLYEFPPRMVDL